MAGMAGFNFWPAVVRLRFACNDVKVYEVPFRHFGFRTTTSATGPDGRTDGRTPKDTENFHTGIDENA